MAIVGITSIGLGLLTLVRRPRIKVGLLPLRKERRRFRRVLVPSNHGQITSTQPHASLTLVAANVGTATGRDLLVNITFPSLRINEIVVADGQVTANPVTGHPMWEYEIGCIHPDDHHLSVASLSLATAGVSDMRVEYEISMSDARPARGVCKVTISKAEPKPPSFSNPSHAHEP